MSSAKWWPFCPGEMSLLNLEYVSEGQRVNTVRQNGWRFADDAFKRISWMKMLWFWLEFHWFVPRSPINNIPALVQMMAWHRSGDKPLSKPISVYWRIYAPFGLNELSNYHPSHVGWHFRWTQSAFPGLSIHYEWWYQKSHGWVKNISLKPESYHDANFFITGGTGGCQYDNLQSHQ